MNRYINFLEDNFVKPLNTLPDLLWNALVVVLAVLLGNLIKSVIRGMFKWYYKYSELVLVRSVLTHLQRPISFFAVLLMLNSVLPLMRLGEGMRKGFDKGVEIALTICFATIAIGALRILEDIVSNRYDLSKSDNLKERKVRTQLQFLRKFIVIIIILITVAVVLLSFDNLRKIGAGLLTGVGIGGIIVGFAAQKSLGNLLAGFQIAFTQPIRLDDVLVVEGEWGRVEDITLTYVVLRIWDQRRLILPIHYFIENPFQNWTRTSSEISGTVFLYLDYTIPVEKLREEFFRLLDANPLWDKKVGVMQVTDSKERTVEIRALMSAGSSGEAFDLRCYIRENLIAFVQSQYPECLPKLRTEFLSPPFGKESFPQPL